MAAATFTVARQFESQDVIGLYVSLAGNDSPRQFKSSDFIGAAELEGLPSAGTTETLSIEIPFRYTGRENVDLRVAELKADGNIGPYKYRSLTHKVTDGIIMDTNAYTSKLAFRNQIEISATSSELTVTLPSLVNLGSDITDTLRLQLVLSDPNRSKISLDGSADSDGDGFDNQYELEYGSDPDDKNSIPTRTGLPAWICRLREI